MINNNNNMDFCWVNKLEKLENITSILQREFSAEINCKFVLINKDDQINLVINKQAPLTTVSNKTILIREDILKMIISIQNKHVNYEFKELLYYFIDKEPDQVFDTYLVKETMVQKGIEELTNIMVEPSVFIFHDIHSIILLFGEKKIKSIIRNKNNTTCKKVSFIDKDERPINVNIIKPSTKFNVTTKNNK